MSDAISNDGTGQLRGVYMGIAMLAFMHLYLKYT